MMFFPETRNEIHELTLLINEGECFQIKGSFEQFWPNPKWPEPDDYSEPAERAHRWFSRRCLVAWENLENGCITIKRPTRNIIQRPRCLGYNASAPLAKRYSGREITFGPVFDEVGTVPDEVWKQLTKENAMLPAMKKVTSSNIAEVGYSGSDLYIKFKDGMTYVHKDVPEDVHKDMMEAESVGKFYHARVKGKYIGQRLSMDAPAPVRDDKGNPHPMNASQK